MKRYSEILRFQEGMRVQHPAPEAAVENRPSGVSAEAGEMLVVFVDLSPALPHRSREIRAVAVESYWASSGSAVARLRRSLAEANRYLVSVNARSKPDQNASGSITSVVFCEEEIFIGQVGTGHAFLSHADGTVEVFPKAAEPILPLGAVSPPVIQISYAPVLGEDKLVLATTMPAEVQTVAQWGAMLSSGTLQQSMDQILHVMKEDNVSGNVVLVHCLEESVEIEERPQPRWRFPSVLRPREKVVIGDDATGLETHPLESTQLSSDEAQRFAEEETAASAWDPYTHVEPLTVPSDEVSSPVQIPVEIPDAESDRDVEGTSVSSTPSWLGKKPWSQLTLPELHWPRITLSRDSFRKFFGNLAHLPVKPLLKALLPGKVEAKQRSSVGRIRVVPKERATVMGGFSLGLLLIVAFITLTTYLQFGGASSAELALAEASEAWDAAYASQSPQDWAHALELAEAALALNPQNTEAQLLRDEAQLQLDASEHSALLSATPIIELGVAPSPRRLLVARSWVYVLNSATDEVFGFPLSEDGITPLSAAPTPILRRGQVLMGKPVEHLVDLAWVEPGPGYPDGAVFIYSDDGTLYIYEPSLGPMSITSQSLPGDLEPGMVTLIETFQGQLYMVNRQENQVLRYASINGIYDSLGRPYFAPGTTPPLQIALNLSLDGRLYLLLGDGTISAYFDGTEDLSFRVQGLPDPAFHPLFMAVESDPGEGWIYLGDAKNERIFVLDKRGRFLHQYRLPGETLKHLEVLAVSESPHVLYLIAENRLYAAPIPALAP